MRANKNIYFYQYIRSHSSRTLEFKMLSKALPLLVAASLHFRTVHAAVSVPRWFGDNMVFQVNAEYGSRAFLNGRAKPGERVCEPTFFVALGSCCDTRGLESRGCVSDTV
jgi:hypothetical protein